MEEAILFGVAEEIITNLASAAMQEIGLLWGVGQELVQLEETISTIKDVLLDAEEQQAHNCQIRNWMKRLQIAVYDADDLLEEFSAEALLRQMMMMHGHSLSKKVCKFFSSSNQLALLLKMGHKARKIKRNLDGIATDRINFHQTVRREKTVVMSRLREQTHSFVPQEEFIGREGDKMAIIQLLLDPKTNGKGNVSVVPIVGIGGLGKTTLAQLVFNDENVQHHFELRMWVCVSDVFYVKLLVKKIIESASNSNVTYTEMETLQKELRGRINGKRYLLVLDDIWNENRQKWISLKNLLTDGAKEGSRIVITTLSKKVAKVVAGTMQPYELRILDENQSWSLFKNLAFEQGQEPKNSNAKEIGMRIVRKCGGIPLAIKTIGSLLYFKNSETEWLTFNEKELSSVSQEEGDILPTLKLSYDHLPSQLKHCFAYCSLFPKDHEICVEKLIKLWTAQGFIKPSDSNQCLEDVGLEYFMDLLWRSFFQEAEIDELGNITKCKMHDVMHDLATSVAGTKCKMLGLEKENIDKETHHVSFDVLFDLSNELPTSLTQAKKIRTILMFKSYFDASPLLSSSMNKQIHDSFFYKFKLLRTLDLNDSGIEILPDSIGTLKHLRYLDLSKNRYIKTLPDSITMLQNLRTLKLSACLRLQGLPIDIWKLVNLRHLEIDGCEFVSYFPCGLSQLTNLSTLSYFPLTKGKGAKPNELAGLNSLRGSLLINHLRYGKYYTVEYNAANLKEKQYLHTLCLSWSSGVEAEATQPVDFEVSLEGLQPHSNLKELNLYYYRGIRFGSWLSSLTNLIKFRLWRCKECRHLPPLSQFPSLKILSVEESPALEYISDGGDSSCSNTVLQSLQKRCLIKLPNLKGWWRDVVNGEKNSMLPSFPHLSTLIIEDCPKLTRMSLFPNLEEQLVLQNTGWKPLQQTMMKSADPCWLTKLATEETQPSSSTSFSSPLSKLKDLQVVGIDDLESLSHLNSFTSLKYLKIENCPNLKQLSPGIQYLSSLQELLISSCPKLEHLSIQDATMSQDIQNINTLQKLQIF